MIPPSRGSKPLCLCFHPTSFLPASVVTTRLNEPPLWLRSPSTLYLLQPVCSAKRSRGSIVAMLSSSISAEEPQSSPLASAIEGSSSQIFVARYRNPTQRSSPQGSVRSHSTCHHQGYGHTRHTLLCSRTSAGHSSRYHIASSHLSSVANRQGNASLNGPTS
jgi:hypothetical protein